MNTHYMDWRSRAGRKARAAPYVRPDGATMVPLAGGRDRFVNALYGAIRAPDAAVFRIADIAPLQAFDRLLALPLADCKSEHCNLSISELRKFSISELWRPASRLTTDIRFMCEDRPVDVRTTTGATDVRTTTGATVWLNGALLLTVAQNGFGIVNSRRGSRPRYAKLKMGGLLRATPQPKPLSHTLWDDIAPVRTERDLKVANHRDDADLSKRGAALKEAEKAAEKWVRCRLEGASRLPRGRDQNHQTNRWVFRCIG